MGNVPEEELKTADGHTVPEKWQDEYRTLCKYQNQNVMPLKACISDLAAANAQLQELQQGRCGMCNESPSNPVHSSGEGQHAFVTSEAEIMRLNAAVVHEAQRYAALEKRLETMATALRYVIKVRAIRCTSHPAGDLSCARCRADAALVSEDGQ